MLNAVAEGKHLIKEANLVLADYSMLETSLKFKDALLANAEKDLEKQLLSYEYESNRLKQQLRDRKDCTYETKELSASIEVFGNKLS